MDEMIRYIFCGLKSSEIAVKEMSKSLGKAIKRQNGFNRRFVIFSLTTTACIYISEEKHKKEKEEFEKRLEEQDRIISMLNGDIAALKIKKGESKM